jgi:hypothetical protein
MRRKVGLFFVCGLLLPLVVATTASGQGSTLQVNVKEPGPGQPITVSGSGYSAPAGTSAITIRLSTRNGTVLGSPTPDSLGRISATFPAPSSPGWYLILATQTTTVNNRHRSFTPGRVRIRVRSASGGAAAPGGRGGFPNSPLGLLAVGSALGLLAAGGTLARRRFRTSNQSLQVGS